MPATEIQEHIKDLDNTGKIEKTDLLEWLKNLEPKDIIDSLNSTENKTAIEALIKTPVQEAVLDTTNKKFEELSADQKDLLILSAWLKKPTLALPQVTDGKFDQSTYDKIAWNEFNELINAEYEANEKIIIKNIIDGAVAFDDPKDSQNPQFARRELKESTFKNLENMFLHLDPQSVKARIAIINSYIARNNLEHSNLPPTKLIDISRFMEIFQKKQEIAITHETKIVKANPTIKFDSRNEPQKTGEFVPIPTEKQKQIISECETMLKNNQEIVSMKLIGLSNGVPPNSEAKVRNQIESSKDLLNAKWFNKELYNNIIFEWGGTTPINADFFSDLDNLNEIDRANKLNKAWAYARALMRIDFLPKKIITDLVNKSQNFNIFLDPQSVVKNDSYKGEGPSIYNNDKLTWWWLVIDTKWNELIEKTIKKDPIVPLKSFLHMNIWVKVEEPILNDPQYSYHTKKLGNIALAYTNGKLGFSYNQFQTLPEPQMFYSKMTPIGQSGSVDLKNTVSGWEKRGHNFNLSVSANDPRLTFDHKNPNLALSADHQWFISLLQECSDKSVDPTQKEYISKVIEAVKALKEVSDKVPI